MSHNTLPWSLLARDTIGLALHAVMLVLQVIGGGADATLWLGTALRSKVPQFPARGTLGDSGGGGLVLVDAARKTQNV